LKSCPGYPARPGSGGVKGLKWRVSGSIRSRAGCSLSITTCGLFSNNVTPPPTPVQSAFAKAAASTVTASLSLRNSNTWDATIAWRKPWPCCYGKPALHPPRPQPSRGRRRKPQAAPPALRAVFRSRWHRARASRSRHDRCPAIWCRTNATHQLARLLAVDPRTASRLLQRASSSRCVIRQRAAPCQQNRVARFETLRRMMDPLQLGG
jgi:hypothetical protein